MREQQRRQARERIGELQVHGASTSRVTYSNRTLPRAPLAAPLTVSGRAIVYRLFDVGEDIDLDRALERLASSAPERARPEQGEAQALQIAHPPVTLSLGTQRVPILGDHREVALSARIYDFGVLSLRARIEASATLTFSNFTHFGRAVDAAEEIPRMLEQKAHELVGRMGNAVNRPLFADVREDYVVYHMTSIDAGESPRSPRELLQDVDLAPLLLGETRPLSDEARRELLPHWFSYHRDDLTILSWDNALIVEASQEDTDVEYILEFANAQLLELRYYDAMLDAELPKLYDRIERARVRRRRVIGAGYSNLLGSMQTLVAEITELVERAENSLKVTDDVYLARLYSAAMELYRAKLWRSGIDRKLSIIRDTYGMLNGEVQTRRSELLEIAIVLLIVFDIVLSLKS